MCQSGGRELKIGIETRDRKRCADLPWSEQLKSKYELLPVDRVVAVAKRASAAANARETLQMSFSYHETSILCNNQASPHMPSAIESEAI